CCRRRRGAERDLPSLAGTASGRTRGSRARTLRARRGGSRPRDRRGDGLSTVATDRCRAAIGRLRTELETPALVLDLDAVERNVETMARWAEGRVSIRPHVKTHKCVEIARLQLAAGACGL